MKLLAVVVFGYLAVGSSDANSFSHHHGHKKHDSSTIYGSNQQNLQGQQDNSESTYLRSNTNGNDQQFYTNGNDQQFYTNGKSQQFYTNDNANSNYQGLNQDQSDESLYSGNSEFGQTYGLQQNTYGQANGNGQQYEGLYQQKVSYNNNNGQKVYTTSADIANPWYSGSVSQEDYVKEQYESGDIGIEIGRKVAEKMVKLFNIVEKYAARNGTVMTNQAQDPFPLRQWAIPMAKHHYLNVADNKVDGLSQGIIKAMYLNAEKNSIDLEYFFDHLFATGNLKSSTGPKGSFHLKMIDTYVNVSTELQNRNRNYAHSMSAQVELGYQNYQHESATDKQSMEEHIYGKYVQFVNRAVENEMIDNSYTGLIGCLRSEIQSAFSLPFNAAVKAPSKLTVENKRYPLIVSLTNTGQTTYRDDQYYDKQRKIEYVAFRQSGGNGGYQMKIKTVLAKHPSWESDVFAQKSGKQIDIKNVAFHAQDIVATAVLDRVPLYNNNNYNNGAYRFVVRDAAVKLIGFRFDVAKFGFAADSDTGSEKLAREIAADLPKIIENGMSAALQQQLYQQQQVCQQNPMECIRC